MRSTGYHRDFVFYSKPGQIALSSLKPAKCPKGSVAGFRGKVDGN